MGWGGWQGVHLDDVLISHCDHIYTSVNLKKSHRPSYELLTAPNSSREGKKPMSNKLKKLGLTFWEVSPNYFLMRPKGIKRQKTKRQKESDSQKESKSQKDC